MDLLFTGELPHHDALAFKERGISTITCNPPLPSLSPKSTQRAVLTPDLGFHTNTERGFLAAVMKGELQKALTGEWESVYKGEKDGAEGFEVVVSQADKDPYEII